MHLTGYLAALANPLHERALVGVLASPLAGVSADALAIADVRGARGQARAVVGDRGGVRRGGGGAVDRGARARGPRRARRVRHPFAAERRRAPRLALDALLERAVAASGYDVHVLGLLGGSRRLANVDKLLRLARDFEAAEGRDLRAFVDHAAALEQAGRREPEAPVEDPDEDAVRLMTIHAAKGLEFDVVVVADLGRRGNQQTADLLVSGDRVGLRIALLDGRTATPALAYDELRDLRLRDDAEEEERVFYVALTRARERLLLSGFADPSRWPPERPGCPPIAWLGPALVEDAARRLDEATPETADATVEVKLDDAASAPLRLILNAPATLGAALRPELAAPASAAEPDNEAALPEPVATPPAPPAAPAAPGTLSYTALTSYARCAYRFYANRVLGLPDVPPPGAGPEHEPATPRAGLDARGRGVLVHALLEELDLARPAAPDPERIEALAAHLGLPAPGPGDVTLATRLVAAFTSGPHGARLAAAARDVRREHEFAFELTPGGPLLTGVLDLLAVEPDGNWLIVDAKTDAVRPDADVAALVEREYGIQRDLYALAALWAGAPRVEVAYAFLERPAEPVTAVFGPEDAPRLEARLTALTDRLAAGDHEPTHEPHAGICATCPARDRLCSRPRELELRPAPPASATH